MTPSFTPYLLLMVDCSLFMGPFLSILRMLYVRIGSIRLQNVLVSAGIRKRSGSQKKSLWMYVEGRVLGMTAGFLGLCGELRPSL
jgi:hypothetical protein